MVGGLAACDVDVGLGAGGGGVDAAGGDGSGGALDGVGGDGVRVVEAEVSCPAPAGGAVFVEVAAGQVDGADGVECDRDRVVDGAGTGVQGEDGAEGAVANVGVGLSGWVEVAVGGSGDDAVTDGEATVTAGGDLVAADLTGGLEEPVGEPVELVAHGVAPVHDGMLEAGLVGGPPAGEGLAVEVKLVVDDVEMPGGVEMFQRRRDVARAQGISGGPVVRVADPMADGELGGVGRVVLAEDAEHAAGFDGPVLGGIADGFLFAERTDRVVAGADAEIDRIVGELKELESAGVKILAE